MNASERRLEACVDSTFSPERSVVLRYRNAFQFGSTEEEDARFKDLLRQTSIQEGARIFFLLTYKGVDVYLLDETSRMHTRTLKAIDGCVTTAKCLIK